MASLVATPARPASTTTVSQKLLPAQRPPNAPSASLARRPPCLSVSAPTSDRDRYGLGAENDAFWEIDCNGKDVDVVELVEMMIKDGWDAVKGLTIKEKMMPTAMKIEDLKDCDGKPLDLSKGDIRENDLDEDYPSEPPTFEIQTIAQLQEWDKAGRPVPENSHNSGNETSHKHRDLKHPDDPLGLVADKLGRAIADERREDGSPAGKKLEPCFAHVYSLGHASVMKQLDKGLEFLGCGAFHAACEVYGVEWSYGYNDEDASGIFPSPPKYCEMHDYKESHYIGDTTLTPEEFERWLQFLSSMDYKQEDPLDPAFPKRVPNVGETPAEFFGSAMHPTYTDQLNPITKEADIGEKYDHHDTSRMWTEFVSEDEEKIITRVGWWGDEYNLLNNNCCFLSDHLLKITCGKPLPHWIFSLAKVGDGIMHGAHFVHDSAAEGMHVLLKGVGSVAHGLGSVVGKGASVVGLGAKKEEVEEAPAPAPTSTSTPAVRLDPAAAFPLLSHLRTARSMRRYTRCLFPAVPLRHLSARVLI